MSMEKMREEFIDWLADEHGLESEWQEDRNCFKDFPAHLAFQAWQASRAALVIELPEPYEHGGPELHSHHCDVVASIEAAGLKVKP
jgi:hypothetical protein